MILVRKTAGAAAPCNRHLPLLRRAGRAGGSAVSALALGLSLLLSGAAASDPEPAIEQIERAVTAFLERLIEEEAERLNWKDLSYTLNITPLTDTSRLSPCSVPLRVAQTGAGSSPLDRLRLEVRCPDPSGWTQVVSTQQNLLLPVLVTNETIERGQALEARHLRLERQNISRTQRSFMTSPEEAIGYTAKRRIRADQVLTPALLGEPVAVRRGQQILIVARQQGVEASTVGEALGDGLVGEIIRVRNLQNDRVIQAKVIEPGVVLSIQQ